MRGKTLIMVVGPTASGKTDLAVDLAIRYNTDILSVDSRQIYRGMAIGTAQPSRLQLNTVTHHFVAVLDVIDLYSSGQYETDALELLDELFAQRDVVVAVGGSGLYIDALPEVDGNLRGKLNRQLKEEGLASLVEELRRLDPAYYRMVDLSNPRRVLRGVEVCLQTGVRYSTLRRGEQDKRYFDIVKIGLDVPRPELYNRINRRVDVMIAAGLEQEARSLEPFRHLSALHTVGYRELFGYFDGAYGFKEAVELIKRNTRRYAKRQMTWFRRDGAIAWFSPQDVEGIEKLVGNFVK